MKKSLIVMWTEIINTVLRPSFIIFTFGLPIIGFVLLQVFSGMGDTGVETFTNLVAPTTSIEAQGYVDLGETIQLLPSDLPEGALVGFPNEESAQQALARGEIKSYYLIPADVVDTGELTLVNPDFSPLSGGENQWMMEWTLMVNMTGGDEELAAQIQYPMILSTVSISPEDTPDNDNPLTYFLPYGVTMFFYMIIFSSASTMLASIGKEKQNSIIEILLLSTTPIQLLAGKIIGRGLVGLLQTAIYTGVGFTLMQMSGGMFEVMQDFTVPVDLILWGLIFFLLGYSLYASLMAGAGALAPNTREASQVTFILLIPLILPLFFVGALISDPNSTLSLILSFFPFSAPVAMMTRIATGTVPFWQSALAVVVIGLTAYVIVIMVARLFRAQTLLSGQEFNPALFFKALVGRA